MSFWMLALSQNAGAQARWRGPLPVENQRPYQAVFLRFPAQNPEVLAKKQTRLGVQFDTANNLLIPGPSNGASVREDFETGRLKIGLRRGIGKEFEIGVSSQLFGRGGGYLDGAIDAYHGLLGLGGNGLDAPQGRDNISRRPSVLFFDDGDGNRLNRASATGIGDTTVSLKRQLTAGDFASALRVGFKIPTGSSSKVFGSGGFDVGVSLDARRVLSPNLALFGQVAALKYGGSRLPNAKKTGAAGGLGLEYRGRRASVVAQIDAQSRTISTGNPFADRTPVLASVGYKRDVGKNKRLWASFSENGGYHNFNAPFFGDVGPDFTLSLGFEVKR